MFAIISKIDVLNKMLQDFPRSIDYIKFWRNYVNFCSAEPDGAWWNNDLHGLNVDSTVKIESERQKLDFDVMFNEQEKYEKP